MCRSLLQEYEYYRDICYTYFSLLPNHKTECIGVRKCSQFTHQVAQNLGRCPTMADSLPRGSQSVKELSSIKVLCWMVNDVSGSTHKLRRKGEEEGGGGERRRSRRRKGEEGGRGREEQGKEEERRSRGRNKEGGAGGLGVLQVGT